MSQSTRRTAALKKLTSADLDALLNASLARIQDMESYLAQGGERAFWEPRLADLSAARTRLIDIKAAQ